MRVDYYSILTELRAKLIQQDIKLTIKELNNKKISTEAKWFISGILFREYTKRSRLMTERIAEYTQLTKRRDILDIAVISRELQKLSGETFNNVMELILRKLEYSGVRNINLTLITLQNSELNRLYSRLTDQINFKNSLLNELESLIPDFRARCDICGELKPISQFKCGYSCCNKCKESVKTGKKTVLRRTANLAEAVKAAEAIKKDLMGGN